jgi:two-component system chemotaxis response regulator CheB
VSKVQIKVLVVEDSPVTRELLLHILNGDPQLKVIGIAANGEEAIALAQRQRPDIITMDVNLPKLNGLEATRIIMETAPTPIIIVSNCVPADEASEAVEALSAGALMALPKPAGLGHPDFEATSGELVRAIKLMSEIKVVRRLPKYRKRQAAPSQISSVPFVQSEIRAVVIGASTGGPIALQTILTALPADFPAPILVVQHMAQGFIEGMAQWLDQACALTVKVASDRESIRPGYVYLAPDGAHLKVRKDGRVSLDGKSSKASHCPSVSYLFSSAAEVYGPAAVGVLLTGMGDDGATGLKALRDKGAVTIAQDEASSIVYGMPKEAMKLGAAQHVLSPEKVAAVLQELAAFSKAQVNE